MLPTASCRFIERSFSTLRVFGRGRAVLYYAGFDLRLTAPVAIL
jgi:hypothetical protein